ncbi:hypothetical protein NDN08_000254 [Rhodosorus marinus]|uniref:Ubiquitin carboxyl-terminal hydrolase n=1 Tax=Rhodosorus marinus TaxID=101924 RepID=A0AAV8UI46_9RHOD|nr:hypothetical protein NDN08_000254 [Rhodosorus marinus]
MTALSATDARSSTRTLRLQLSRGGKGDVVTAQLGGSVSDGGNVGRKNVNSESVTSVTSESGDEGGELKNEGVERAFPPGLLNLGNTCYFNSVLQVLYHLKSFRDALSEWNPPEDADPYRVALALSLKRLFVQMADVERRNVSQSIPPNHFLSVLREQNSDFTGYDQEDAHEFLRFLLDKVSDAFRASRPSSNPHQAYQQVSKRPRKSSEENPFQKLFEGGGATYTRCFECDTVKRREESFLDVSLPVQSGCSLSWALSQQVQRETLTDKYDCELCLTKTEAERWWQLNTIPPVVTLHLKLFTYDRNIQGKVAASVRCPQSICFSRWCSNGSGESMYQLDAVIVHEGSTMTSGHYYAYVNENGWYCFDDSDVSVIDEASLRRKLFTPVKPKKTAYLLFYRKTDLESE